MQRIFSDKFRCVCPGCWYELAEGNGSDLGLKVEKVVEPANPVAIAVRISVSYAVLSADVAEVVSGPYEDIHIAIRKPHLDAVTHYGQVHAICNAFRSVLDDVHARLDKSKIVHVFYAGPVSLGFSLGRCISRTIHHCIIVYNYTAPTVPHYAWGIKVNGNSSPETMVVKTVPVVKE